MTNHPGAMAETGRPLVVEISRDCIKCGLCVQLCPVDAVRVKHRAFQINDACIGCLACLEACPVGAIIRLEN